MPEVTCVGVVVADVIVRPVDAWPQPGRLSLVDHIELHGGGLAYTTAGTLAKLGVSSAVVGRAGGRPAGRGVVPAGEGRGVPHQSGHRVGSAGAMDERPGALPAVRGPALWEPGGADERGGGPGCGGGRGRPARAGGGGGG